MQKAKYHILSTRPLPDPLEQEAALQNIHIDTISFIHTSSIIDAALTTQIRKLSQRPITAVFTSVNAVIAIAEVIQKPVIWKAYTINNTTGRRVTEVLKMRIAGMAANAAALADAIIKDGIQEVHFFCGNLRRDELPQKLREANISVTEIVVYETQETPQVIENVYDGILFFSPSAVHSFFSVNSVSADTKVFSIGFTTAETILQYTGNPVLIADKTSKEDLVRQLIAYFNTQKKESQ